MVEGQAWVDAWIQHPNARWIGDPMFESLRRWMKIEVIPEEFPAEFTVGALDDAGIGRALVSAWWGPQGPLLHNDEVAALVAQAPGRLYGVASVDLRRPREAVRELRRCVKELGFKALRVLPWLWELPPNHRYYYPLYAECIELGVPFCLQIGHTGPLRSSEHGRPIPYLEDVALDFPELVIVGGHVGAPWVEEAIFLATKFPNVYLDSSAYVPRRYPPAFVEFLRGRGRHKCLFGSNWPMIAPSACVAGLAELGLEAGAERLFMGENSARVFKL